MIAVLKLIKDFKFELEYWLYLGCKKWDYKVFFSLYKNAIYTENEQMNIWIKITRLLSRIWTLNTQML